MDKPKFSSFLKYLSYIIEIILVYILFSVPNLIPEIYGGKPSLLIVIALSIAVFEREIPSMIFGLGCGVLIDFGYSNAAGTFTVLLTVVCFFLGYAANNIAVFNLFSTLFTSALVVAGLFSLHFLFTYVMKDYGGAESYFIHHYISRMVQTFLFTPVFYYLNRFIHAMLTPES